MRRSALNRCSAQPTKSRDASGDAEEAEEAGKTGGDADEAAGDFEEAEEAGNDGGDADEATGNVQGATPSPRK